MATLIDRTVFDVKTSVSVSFECVFVYFRLSRLSAQNTQNSFGLPSWSYLTITVYGFTALCHSSTMKLAHRAAVDIMPEATKRPRKVMTGKKANKSESAASSDLTSVPIGGISELKIYFICATLSFLFIRSILWREPCRKDVSKWKQNISEGQQLSPPWTEIMESSYFTVSVSFSSKIGLSNKQAGKQA